MLEGLEAKGMKKLGGQEAGKLEGRTLKTQS